MPYLDNVIFKVEKDFTLSPNSLPMPGQQVSFKAGDIVMVSHLYRTKGGMQSGIPVQTVKGWEYPLTASGNIKLVTVCTLGEDETADECVSPNALVIDNESEAGEMAPPPQESSGVSAGALVLTGLALFLIFK